MNEELTRTVEPEVIKMNLLQRVVALITAPGKLMENIKAHPVIFVPLLLAVTVGLGSAAIGTAEMDMYLHELSNLSIERYGTDHFDTGATVDEFGEVIAAPNVNIIAAISMLVSAIVSPLLISIFATLLLFALSKIMRGKITFRQMFSMYMHIYIISAWGSLVSTGFMVFNGRVLDITSLAAVFAANGDMTQLSFNVFSAIGVFPIWVAVLLFIGLKSLNEFSSIKAGIITALAFLTGITVHVVGVMSTWWALDAATAMEALQ